jgi:hypothetical protein
LFVLPDGSKSKTLSPKQPEQKGLEVWPWRYEALSSNARIHTTIPTSFLTKVLKTYDGEKTASSTNVAGKSGYPSARN